MEDLIRRADAIEAIREVVTPLIPTLYGAGIKAPLDCEMALKAIPSAENDIVSKLKSAIESEELCKSCPTAERISSENLLGAMALGFSYGINADRQQGEWIPATWQDENCPERLKKHKCSACGNRAERVLVKTKLVDNYYCNKAEPITEYTHEEQLSNFCPNCGARMVSK